MKKHLTITALAVSFAFGGIATAADDKTTTPESRAGAGKHRDPDAVFKRLDANGDGKVTKEEFGKLRERMQKAGGKRGGTAGKGQDGDRFFTHLDANNDGVLTLEEFKKMGERRAHAGASNADPEKLKQRRERRRAASGGDAAKKPGTEEKPKEPAK